MENDRDQLQKFHSRAGPGTCSSRRDAGLAKERITPPGYTARAQAIPGQAIPGDIRNGEVSRHRATALRECNGKADKFSQYAWGNFSFDEYRACMAQHDENE